MEQNSVNNRVKGLKPFKKGQSGNLNGRPLGQRNYATLYREALIKLAKEEGITPEEWEDNLIKSGLKHSKRDIKFYQDTLDRIHGKASQSIDITSDGKALPTPIYMGKSNKKKRANP